MMILAFSSVKSRAAMAWPALALALAAAGCTRSLASHAVQAEHPAHSVTAPNPYIVFGFMGGIVRRDDPIRSEYKLAENLRADYPASVHVETFENHRRGEARKTTLRLIDTNHDGVLSDEEKRSARIILYGHSWGGAAVVTLARELEKDGIPILLTVQVDSVGAQDEIVPANVSRAANFYQPSGLIHGVAEIRAAAASHTEIVGNFRFEYKDHTLDCREFPWYERVFAKSHTKIACDPNVWAHVETLIREELSRTGQM